MTETVPSKEEAPPRPFLTPLVKLEHLVLRNVHIASAATVTLLRLFDGLAYHKAPFHTIECTRLFGTSMGLPAYKRLAAHLEKGAFPALSSLTVHDMSFDDDTTAALIKGMGKGCRALKLLSLGRDSTPNGPRKNGNLLLEAMVEVASGTVRNGSETIKPFDSLKALHFDWPEMPRTVRSNFVGRLSDRTMSSMTESMGRCA